MMQDKSDLVAQDLPEEVSRGTVKIAQFELEVVQLSNGMRAITEESIQKLLEAFGAKFL